MSRNIPSDDPLAVALVDAIHRGDVATLQRLLDPAVATARIVDGKGVARTLLHVAADWPGHFPNGRQVVAALIAAGADPNTHVPGPAGANETPLHSAASSDDVEVLEALLDGGADIEAPGAVFTGGAAMSDAVVFAQWGAARALLARGARTTLSQAAALGLLDRVEALVAAEAPDRDTLTGALWHACRGGQRATAAFLLDRGADLHWLGWDHKTPVDAARDAGDPEFVRWLEARR